MGRRSREVAASEVNAVVPVTVNLQPVSYEAPEAEAIEVAGLPAEWGNAEVLGGFAPSPLFEVPGEALFGTYVGVRDNVGPNNSRVYEIMAYQGADKKEEMVALWGSTALDRMFDSAYPKIKAGDKVGVVYLGSKPTKRNQNPVKLFKLLVKRPGDKAAETMSSAKNGAPDTAKKPVEINPATAK